MKKIMVLLAVIMMMTITLVACGSKASDKAISVAERAVEIADEYLDNEITYSEASEEIDELEEDMEYVDNLDHDAENTVADFGISADLLSLSVSMTIDNYKSTSDSYDKVLEARNKLADDAGLKER